MTLVWRNQLDTGNARIDADHRQLFELINAVELALKECRGVDALTSTLNELYDYTNYHFEREEQIMIALDYNEVEQHKLAHYGLKAQLVAIRAKIVAATEAGENIAETEIDALTKLLRTWLVDHIVAMDLTLKPVLARAGSSYTAE